MVERIEARRPELSRLLQPPVDLVKCGLIDPIQTLLGKSAAIDQSGFAEHAEMLGDGRPAYVEFASDGAGG